MYRFPNAGRRRCRSTSLLSTLVTAAFVLLVSGCGTVEDAPIPSARGADQPSDDPTAVLAGIEQTAHAAGTVQYEAVTKSARDDAPLQVEGRMTGVLDLRAGRGTADLELLPLQDAAADAAAEDPAAAADLAALGRMQLSWTNDDITVALGAETWTGPRDTADDALISRVPGEPAGLFTVATLARPVSSAAGGDIGGSATTRYRAVADPRAAVAAGLGTQAHLALAELPELPLEVWVDDAGRAVRIRYSFTVPSLIENSTRTTVTTYTYTAWGEPVDAAN